MKAQRSSRSSKKKPARATARDRARGRRSSATPASRRAGKNRKQGTGNGRRRPLITTVIFDLDDTLYDCFRQRVQSAHRHAAQAMVDAGVDATVADVFKVRMTAFQKDPQLKYIDEAVCRHFKVTQPELVQMRARAAYFSTPVGKLTLFPASRRVLRTLAKCGVRNFIVSFGDPETQHAKVRALGLDREKSVQRIFFADTGKLLTKEAIFMVIQQHEEKDPRKILVVGDRPSSEIKAGNSLSFHTVRLHHGEFATLAPVGNAEKADHQIYSIAEVLQLPYRFGV